MTVVAARRLWLPPQTRFVRELFIGGHTYDDDYEPGPDVPANVGTFEAAGDHVLLRWPQLRHVRRFQYGWTADEAYGDHCEFHCRLSAANHAFGFVQQMPDVEEVLVFAQNDDATALVGLPMPRLRVLQMYHGRSYPLEDLADNPSLTKLTDLLCHPHAVGDQAYIRQPQLRAVCRSKYLTSLTHLRLRLTDFGDEGAREIVDSGILKQLKALDPTAR